MREFWVRQRLEHPVVTTLVTGLITAAVMLAVYALAPGTMQFGVLAPLAGGTAGAVAASFAESRRLRSAFPPDTDIDRKVAVWRTARDGGPVEEAGIAPVLAHHARWVLDRPHPAVQLTLLGVVAAALLVIGAIQYSAAERGLGMWFLVLGAAMAVAGPFAARNIKHRRMAERVLSQAIEAQRGPR